MIVRQLFDPATSTYTYIVASEQTRDAVIIDPVLEQVDRDSLVLSELGLKLRYVLETHVHADHITGAASLRDRTGAKIVFSKHAEVEGADRLVEDGDRVEFGDNFLEARLTPGHTAGCVSWLCGDGSRVFTGDALLIRGCGRTDFQEGDPSTLYQSIHEKIFSLPDATLIYPGHDYQGRSVSTVAEEKTFNRRLGNQRSEAAFVEIMEGLSLPYPRYIDVALPANKVCGRPEPKDAAGNIETTWAPIVRTPGGIPEVTTAWTRGEVRRPMRRFRFIDVREPHEWVGELGHVEQAELVPLRNLPLVAEAWDRDEAIVIVCRSGGRSGQAARLLESMNFNRVASMAGGMLRWRQEEADTRAA